MTASKNNLWLSPLIQTSLASLGLVALQNCSAPTTPPRDYTPPYDSGYFPPDAGVDAPIIRTNCYQPTASTYLRFNYIENGTAYCSNYTQIPGLVLGTRPHQNSDGSYNLAFGIVTARRDNLTPTGITRFNDLARDTKIYFTIHGSRRVGNRPCEVDISLSNADSLRGFGPTQALISVFSNGTRCNPNVDATGITTPVTFDQNGYTSPPEVPIMISGGVTVMLTNNPN